MKELLVEGNSDQQQGLISAVEKFALMQDMRQLSPVERRYRELIPKTTPGPGQQYAFEVNLDQCTGCKACVVACHHENGLEEDETWRSVGLLYGGSSQYPVMQHITSACHHCLDPACMNGCPVNAYEKDKQTGIVKHLEDQCIGCQYCTFTCAYDVPKYSKKKGIVHKCDMCISRLNVGEAPACVRACPSEAIRITLVDTAVVRENPADYVRIPEAPDSRYTLPTTKYLRKKAFPENTTSIDFYSISPEHSHTPLIVMLVLTQFSVGIFCAGLFSGNHQHIFIALGVGLLALAASVFHLGRPLYAFRAVLGLKRSWLSREIVAFGGFALLSTAYAVDYGINSTVNDIFAMTTAILGIFGVFCSAMVYKVTKRPFWDNHVTTLKFFLTTGILGTSGILLVTMITGAGQTAPVLCGIIMILTLIKLMVEATILRHSLGHELTSLKKTAILMMGRFRPVTSWRFVCGILGGIVLPIFFWAGVINGFLLPLFIFFLLLTGEFFERYLFFRTVIPLKSQEQKFSNV